MHSSAETDESLAGRAQGGDLDAFNRLVERYQVRVFNLALRLVGSPETAEDVAQDSFVAAFRKIDQFAGRNFVAWLLRITANTAKDELRRRSRRPSQPFDQIFGTDRPNLEPHDPSADVATIAEQAALSRILWSALQEVPDPQRLAIVLVDLEGYGYAEAADALDCSTGTVKSRVSRGRARLRELLSRDPELLAGFRRLEE